MARGQSARHPNADVWMLRGAGGSSAFADPDRRVAFGYATTLMLFRPDPANDPRVKPLVQAVYDALD